MAAGGAAAGEIAGTEWSFEGVMVDGGFAKLSSQEASGCGEGGGLIGHGENLGEGLH